MDETPVVPLAVAAVVLLVGPVRRRAVAVTGAAARAGAGVLTATIGGIADVASTAVRGDRPTGESKPSR